MLGVYDFCGHYEWTFAWLEEEGSEALVHDYWEEAISRDSQIHARELILPLGFEGMARYWTPTLEEEGGECVITKGENAFRIDMHACPSKGFLMRNGLEQYSDYCDHCIGWIQPLMQEAGFRIEHEHNHRGQCWWEFRRQHDSIPVSTPGEISAKADIRLMESWPGKARIHHFTEGSFQSSECVLEMTFCAPGTDAVCTSDATTGEITTHLAQRAFGGTPPEPGTSVPGTQNPHFQNTLSENDPSENHEKA